MSRLKQLRNLWWVMAIVLLGFSDAFPQTSYIVTDLGTLNSDDNLSCAMALNNYGWTLSMNGVLDPFSDSAAAKLVKGRSAINIGSFKIDLGTLGGQNSWMNWGAINDRAEAVGFSETSVPDPDGEDFCGFGTGLTCRPFLWRDGHMSALPTAGGNNGSASDINNRGQIAGYAQTNVTDSGCPPYQTTAAVLWENGKIQLLPTVSGDPDGVAYGINDAGQAVGYSGTCTSANHAVSWRNGISASLPDLGTGAIAQEVNNQGEIVGIVGSADGSSEYAAVWQNGTLINLGTLPGDFAAIGTGINNRGQVVGSTLDANFNWAHAFIWQDGVMTDLNTLFPADSNLYATMANKINDRGQISGMATVLSGPHAGQEIHAFLATPVNRAVGTSVADVAGTRPHVPANLGKQLLSRSGAVRLKH